MHGKNTTGYVRTGEEMKKKWICLSSERRKKLALNRREQRKTGGGFLPSEATLRPIDKTKGIIGETFISGVEGGINVLDTFTTTDALLVSPSNMTHASIECQPSVGNSRLSGKGTQRTVSSESQQRDDLMTRLVKEEEDEY
eukprot:XP_011432432.1 PREDICTED: uncharacterized protein LOC105331798 [Crassostrea gigas]